MGLGPGIATGLGVWDRNAWVSLLKFYCSSKVSLVLRLLLPSTHISLFPHLLLSGKLAVPRLVDNTTTNLPRFLGVVDGRFFPGLVEVHLQLIGLLLKEAALVGTGIRRRPAAAVATGAALFGIGSCDVDRKTIT